MEERNRMLNAAISYAEKGLAGSYNVASHALSPAGRTYELSG